MARTAKTLGAPQAARLTEFAARRRADGSRGWRARRAWLQVVRACAAGDPAAHEAIRSRAADLPDADVGDLLAVAPSEPADQAAYLTLIGQSAQRQALDPDGSLLALAYRAAPPEVRERLRTVMAAESDGEVIRVVVTGDRRDRIAEMTYDELDYLGHHLAERQDWDELRRLTRDLPPAKAAAAAALLPVPERAGGVAEVLSGASVRSPGQLRDLVDRLPREPLITHEVSALHYGASSYYGASFSPDTSELALRYSRSKLNLSSELRVETLRIGTGEVTRHFDGNALSREEMGDSILHLGDEILVRLQRGRNRQQIVRILPRYETVGAPTIMSDMRRSSCGAVVVCAEGPAFVDPGADELRHQPIPRLSGRRWFYESGAIATLPAARLVAFCGHGDGYVATEDGEFLRWVTVPTTNVYHPALSFLSENSLALHHEGLPGAEPETQIWEFPPDGAPPRIERHLGATRDRWPLDTWRVPVLDDAFAARVYSSGWHRWTDTDLPWLPQDTSGAQHRVYRKFLTMSSNQDLFAVFAADVGFEVHSPHLPSARTLLEQPLLHSRPHDLQRIRELRPKIGDPAVRDALDLLTACLSERFGGDIALGASGPVAPGGPHDIALGPSTDKPQGTV